ncbi:tetratricopeptide repeat protein [bacterium]|nr:tetratricopeptide repeat protein [bacterium]
MSIELAEKYETEEQYDKAYDEYKNLLNASPKNIDLLQKVAHLACILEKYEEAESCFTKILERDKTNLLAYEQLMDMFIDKDKFKYYTYRGNLHVLQGQLEHAAGDYQKALGKAPEEDKANATRFVLANLYFQLGKENKAIDEYLRILDTHEAPEEVYINLSKIYENQGILSSAQEILERAIKDGLESDNIKNTLTEIYLKNNRTDEASKLSKDELVQLRCLLEDEKFSEAEQKILALNDKYRKNPKFLTLVAQYYYSTKDYDKALEYVMEFAKFDKNSPLIYQMRALIYEAKNMAFEEHYNWGKYNQIRGNQDVAINEYLLAHQANASDSQLVLQIAELLDEIKDSTRAIEFYEKLYNLEPENAKALEKLGKFRYDIGDYKMTVKYFNKLYELKKCSSEVLKILAVSYEKIKDVQNAIEFYNKYLKSSAIAEYEVAEINRKIDNLEKKCKKYGESDVSNDGLIGVIMRLFKK